MFCFVSSGFVPRLQRRDTEQHCSADAWDWRRDSGKAWGRGAGGAAATDVLFPVLFLFSKTDTRDSGACPLPGGVTRGLPHLSTPMETSVSCPGDTRILCTFAPPSSPVAGLRFSPPSDPCISYYVRYHLPEKRPCADYWEHCSCFCVFSYLVVWF